LNGGGGIVPRPAAKHFTSESHSELTGWKLFSKIKRPGISAGSTDLMSKSHCSCCWGPSFRCVSLLDLGQRHLCGGQAVGPQPSRELRAMGRMELETLGLPWLQPRRSIRPMTAEALPTYPKASANGEIARKKTGRCFCIHRHKGRTRALALKVAPRHLKNDTENRRNQPTADWTALEWEGGTASAFRKLRQRCSGSEPIAMITS
jgi:hypothetical protein